MIDLRSDNTSGLAPRVLDAIVRANRGTASSYGADDLTTQLRARIAETFGTDDLDVHLVFTGTAANALALAALCPSWGAVVCHMASHILVDECGAPELFTGGARLMPVGTHGAKLDAAAVDDLLRGHGFGSMHACQPKVLSLTQPSEWGRTLSVAETGALAEVAKKYGLSVHMDGARFAHAVVATGATPAELTWKAGIDVLTLGATKNGCMAAEAIVFFGPARNEASRYLRKRAGQVMSKGRFMAAQMLAWLEDGYWLDLAGHGNAMAARLADGLATMDGVAMPYPAEANLLFPRLTPAFNERLARHAQFHDWQDGTSRLVCSWATEREAVDRLVRALHADQ